MTQLEQSRALHYQAPVLRLLRFIPPAQPVERSRPPKGPDWLHEVKWDGYRAQLVKLGDRVAVLSRNGKKFTGRFIGVWEALRALPAKSAIIDAEIVACREDGVPDFRALHSGNYSDEILCAWCFDLMEFNGVDLTPLPLMARKMKLGTLLKRYDHGSLRYSEPFTDPEKLLRECSRLRLEGIVSKKKDAPYRSGHCDWIKVKCAQWREANQDRGELFGAGRQT